MAAARGTERAANCLATLFARLTPPTQVFPFPQTASAAANKDGGARPRHAVKGGLSSGFGEALSARGARWGPRGTLNLPRSVRRWARRPRADCKVVRNNYRVIDGGPDRCQVQVPFETAVCVLRG